VEVDGAGLVVSLEKYAELYAQVGAEIKILEKVVCHGLRNSLQERNGALYKKVVLIVVYDSVRFLASKVEACGTLTLQDTQP